MKKRERGSRGERHKGRGVLRASVSGQWAAPGGPCQWTPGPLQTAVPLVLPVPLTFIHPLHPACMYPRVLCAPLPTFQHLLDVRRSNPAHMLQMEFRNGQAWALGCCVLFSAFSCWIPRTLNRMPGWMQPLKMQWKMMSWMKGRITSHWRCHSLRVSCRAWPAARAGGGAAARSASCQ